MATDNERLARIEAQLDDLQKQVDKRFDSLTEDVAQIKTKVFNGLTVDVALLQRELDSHLTLKQREIEQTIEQRQLEALEDLRASNRKQQTYGLIGIVLTILGLVGARLFGIL